MSDWTNDADAIEEQYNELLKEAVETGADMLRLMRLISQTLLDCHDRMEDDQSFAISSRASTRSEVTV